MRQSTTGSDSLNQHRLQSLFVFWPSVYHSSVAIHTTGDVASLVSLATGENTCFSQGSAQAKSEYECLVNRAFARFFLERQGTHIQNKVRSKEEERWLSPTNP